MKVQGFLKGTGKVGNLVVSRVGGETIAREYNPSVSNPNTLAQTNQRAKMKLMSQLAAVFAPVIVIPKNGLQSSRNLFVKKNFEFVSANEGIAQITYENLQLTNGNAGLPAVIASRADASMLLVHLAESVANAVSRVVYVLYIKTGEQNLQFVGTRIADAAGADGTWPASFAPQEGDLVVFAYGMKDLNSKASVQYRNYQVTNGEDIATLALNRSLSMSDYQFTKTRGTTLFAGETESIVIGANQARVWLTPSGPGSVEGAGVYNIGDEVTLTATPNVGARFIGWRYNGSEDYVSFDETYTFEISDSMDLIAVFATGSVMPQVTVAFAPSNNGIARIDAVIGGAQYSTNERLQLNLPVGTEVELTAYPAEGRAFGSWIDFQGQRSTSNPLSFIVATTSNDYIEWIARPAEEGGEG